MVSRGWTVLTCHLALSAGQIVCIQYFHLLPNTYKSTSIEKDVEIIESSQKACHGCNLSLHRHIQRFLMFIRLAIQWNPEIKKDNFLTYYSKEVSTRILLEQVLTQANHSFWQLPRMWIENVGEDFLAFLCDGWEWIHLQCLNRPAGSVISIISYDTERICQVRAGNKSWMTASFHPCSTDYRILFIINM